MEVELIEAFYAQMCPAAERAMEIAKNAVDDLLKDKWSNIAFGIQEECRRWEEG